MDLQRLFIAFPFSEAIREKCLALQGRGKKQGLALRWCQPEQLHLTLVFLGNINAEEGREVEAILQAAAERFSPFELRISGLGAFPNYRKPRVLWLGLSENPCLMVLQQNLSEALVEFGIAREARPFHPHLSLGRFRRGPRDEMKAQAALVKQWIKTEADLDLGNCEMATILLMESRLRPQGSEYYVRLRVPLAIGDPMKNEYGISRAS